MNKALRFLAISILGAWATTARAEPVAVTSTPVPLNEADTSVAAVGPLRYLGGVHLTSPDRRFGGFSTLGVSADGRRMVSISDRGAFMSAAIRTDADGILVGIDDVDMSALTDTEGRILEGKHWTDAESMSPGVNGEIIVSFERDHRLLSYPPGENRAKFLRPPAEITSLPDNHGIEALTLLDDGRLLAIAEGDPKEDATIAWVSRPDGWDVMTYRTSGGYRPTGAATLPGGDVLILERYFTPRDGVRIRIVRLASGVIQAGAELKSHLVADLKPPFSIDNFEGIEARMGADGNAIVYLISDDNFNPSRQRTLFLMFRYVP